MKELINNEYHVPVIIVFTRAIEKEKVDKMGKKLKSLFPDNAFIPVLGRKTKDIEQFGLDDLLNQILKSLESVEKG